MKDLVIIGGKAPQSLSLSLSDYRKIIAADSGYDTARKLGIAPDEVVGDFDSTSFSSELEELGYNPCPRDKDDTDAAIAIKKASNYDLVGGGEGRLDHTLSLLSAFRTIRVPDTWFMLSDTIIFRSGRIVFEAPIGIDLSIIPLNEAVVTTSGLRWDIKETLLSPFFISQSNRVEKSRVEILADRVIMLRFFPEDFSKVSFLR